jgi:capsular polysaccharide transport system permease protein
LQTTTTGARSFKARLASANVILWLTVILPTALAVVYFGLIASDVYISESRFVVRSPQRAAQTGIGALLQGTGFSRSQDDTYSA